MSRKLFLCLIATSVLCALGASGSIAVGADSCGNCTFESLGYETSTFTSGENFTILNFSSPYVESIGELNLHLKVIDGGGLDYEINGALLEVKGVSSSSTAYWVKTEIPTGMIDLGNNTISITFVRGKITLLEDSTINIMPAII